MDEMTPRHRAMMRSLIDGKTREYVADLFNVAAEQLNEIIDSPLFKEEMAKLQKELDARIIETRAQELIKEDPTKILKEATEMAAQALKGALQDTNVHGRIKASIEVLNRAREAEVASGETVEATQGFKDMMERCMKETQQGGSPKPAPAKFTPRVIAKFKDTLKKNGDEGGSKGVLETENTG